MATIAEQPHHRPWRMARVIIASSAGTAFEWYDFFIFGSLAPVISKVFFAGLDPTPALLAALALFAAGFAFRPLGALIFGVVGDKLGRKGAFLVTVSLMGAATFLIGFLPTYAQAGSSAATMLIVLRILQGIALGGEYGGAAIYVAEHAPQTKRGASTGWIQASASFGLLAALLVIVVTRTAIGEDAFAAWGWRIPFLVSAVLLAISVWMRAKLAESPEFARLRDEGDLSHAPLRESFGKVEEPQTRADRLLRHHVRAGGRLVFHLLLLAGLSRKVARPTQPDQGPADDRDDRRQRAAVRLFRLAQRPPGPQAGHDRRHAARAAALFPRIALDRRCRQPPADRGGAANSVVRRHQSRPPARSNSTPSAPPSSSAPATSPSRLW